MKEALYLEDSYLKEFEAEVLELKDNKYIVLDKTAFYPNSGGQPHDTGVFVRKNEEFPIVYVGKFSGNISHEVSKPGLNKGYKIIGKINWDRRYVLMRMHTAAHILSGIFHKEAGALITGNQLELNKSRIDFSLENFDREKINRYIAKANEIVKKGLQIKTYFLKREEAMKIPDVVKLASVLPPNVENLRIVAIDGFDKQADGGTHVKNTSEVGTIEFIKAENKGKSNRRVYYRLI